MQEANITIKVCGDYACFTRPEFKVERVSYPMMTASAARGVLEAIFWKPEIRYQIRQIGVVKPGREMVLVRNELSDRQGANPIAIQDKRQQRSSVILKDVAYVIKAAIVRRPHTTDPLVKYLDQFQRRASRGQYHHTPYLGTREFAADFAPIDGDSEVNTEINRHLGTMLFDVAFVESRTSQDFSFRVPNRQQPANGYAQAVFLVDAEIRDGWLTIPREKYDELYRLEGGYV